jgi:cysteine synthase
MLDVEESIRDRAADPAEPAELLARLHRSVPWQAIGGTPLVPIPVIRPGADVTALAKLEGINLGGSLKDRVALRMIEDGIAAGEITARTTIVESSSGNTAVGLAQVCACLGLRFISVVDRRAVDAAGSQIFGCGPPVERRLPGMGAAFAPPFARDVVPWRVSVVSEAGCEKCCVELAHDYGLLVGASSGGVWSAFKRLAAEPGRDGGYVLIFPDRGERYLEAVSWSIGGGRG